jgi:hypothetical protein
MEATSWHIWFVVERSRREPQAERENQRNCGLPIADCEIGGDGGGRSFVAALLRMTGVGGSLLGMVGADGMEGVVAALLRMTGLGGSLLGMVGADGMEGVVAALLRMTGLGGSLLGMVGADGMEGVVASLLGMTGLGGWMTGVGGSRAERIAQRAAPAMKRR